METGDGSISSYILGRVSITSDNVSKDVTFLLPKCAKYKWKQLAVIKGR